MNDERLHWAASLVGGVGAVAIGLLASLPTPVFVLDKALTLALIVGGFVPFGVSLNTAAKAGALRRAADELRRTARR